VYYHQLLRHRRGSRRPAARLHHPSRARGFGEHQRRPRQETTRV